MVEVLGGVHVCTTGFAITVSRLGQRTRNRHLPLHPVTRSMLSTIAPRAFRFAKVLGSSALLTVNSRGFESASPGRSGCFGRVMGQFNGALLGIRVSTMRRAVSSRFDRRTQLAGTFSTCSPLGLVNHTSPLSAGEDGPPRKVNDASGVETWK